MSNSEALKEILNFCENLNQRMTDDKSDDYKNSLFPKVCERTVAQEDSSKTSNALYFDVNENPSSPTEAGAISLLQAIKNIDTPSGTTTTTGDLTKIARQYCCTIYNANKKKEAAINAKQDYEIALKRAEVTRDPATSVSRYGTHFAFGKPLRFSSIPYLLTIIIFFSILSIGILLEISGRTVSISSSGPSWFSNLLSAFSSSWSQSDSSFKLILIVISVLVGAIGYYGAGKLREYLESNTTTQK
jgi:hypothetical protein